MNGAEAIIRTLIDSGVRVCFANPGTSETHFAAALDRYPEMRGVLCLFEAVATGAADGYGRMTGHPAATLLHLGPGFANGLANLHNARRAGTPVLNLVGEHSAAHKLLDAAGDCDIGPVAGAVSAWLSRPADGANLGRDIAEAVAASVDWSRAGFHWTGTPGSVSTVIVPADLSWSDGAEPAAPVHVRPVPDAAPDAMDAVEKVLGSGEPAALLLDGDALTQRGIEAADRIAQVTGARLFCPVWPARVRRGAGVPSVSPLEYRPEDVRAQLGNVRHLVLAGARAPVARSGYPGLPGEFAPPGVQVHEFAGEFTPAAAGLAALADRIAPYVRPRPARQRRPEPPSGPLTRGNWAAVIGRLLPREAIVCDEAVTSGLGTLPEATMSAAPHDTLGLAAGQGLPLAAGAAIACPDRPVICLEADGSAMCTISALWTLARERLNVTAVILSNSGPDLDFTAISEGLGVPAARAATTEELAARFAAALAEPGPHLIEAVLTGRS